MPKNLSKMLKDYWTQILFAVSARISLLGFVNVLFFENIEINWDDWWYSYFDNDLFSNYNIQLRAEQTDY